MQCFKTYFTIQVVKANGLTLLLDANTFDYTFHRHASEGFKIAVEHHLDQPLMSMKELDITPGLETQVTKLPKSQCLKWVSMTQYTYMYYISV